MMNHLASNPCLIILAHDLAENNTGLDYLRLIKTMNRNIPVLFLLSQNNLSMAVHALTTWELPSILKNSIRLSKV